MDRSEEAEPPNGRRFRRTDPAASREVTPETHRERKRKERRSAHAKKVSKNLVRYRHLERCISRSPNMRARLESKTDETFRQELEKLYREKNQKIYRAAYGVTGNRQDAKDALQNVFLRLIQRPPSSDFKKNPEGYLCRVGINDARSIGRRQERQKLADVDVNDLDIPLTAAIWGGDGDTEHLEDLDRRLRFAREQLEAELEKHDTSLWSLYGDGWSAAPLKQIEFQVLTAVSLLGDRGTLKSITQMVDKWTGREMVGRVYLTLGRFAERELITVHSGPATGGDKPFDRFEITEDGDRALRRAKIERKQLVTARESLESECTERPRW